MKQFFFAATTILMLIACNNGEKKKIEKKEPQANDISQNPDYQKGLVLITKSDCLTCHKVEEKATGPAYRDIANKYAKADTTITTLASKIMKGGAGNWGTIPMTPHPLITKADAEQMAKYVMLLKTN